MSVTLTNDEATAILGKLVKLSKLLEERLASPPAIDRERIRTAITEVVCFHEACNDMPVPMARSLADTIIEHVATALAALSRPVDSMEGVKADGANEIFAALIERVEKMPREELLLFVRKADAELFEIEKRYAALSNSPQEGK